MEDTYISYRYEVKLDPRVKDINNNYIVFWEGERKILDWNIFQVSSIEMLTFNEVREKLAGTNRIKEISGEFKDIVTVRF